MGLCILAVVLGPDDCGVAREMRSGLSPAAMMGLKESSPTKAAATFGRISGSYSWFPWLP